jgi:hypothetical protein
MWLGTPLVLGTDFLLIGEVKSLKNTTCRNYENYFIFSTLLALKYCSVLGVNNMP